MSYQIAPLFCRPWTLLGIERKLIESHYENNYGGAFTRLNAIYEELAALDPATAPPHVLRRLKQEEAAALNSLVLHEIYFASLGGDGRVVGEVMANALARDFGSIDRWRSEFVALANSLDAGSSWVLLT
jgi:Fe-Mn family superoxide dismutase